MKATGMLRKVDFLGRITIPKELLRVMSISAGDPMEIYTDAGKIILQKYQPGCQFCDNSSDLLVVSNISICRKCATEIVKKFHN